MRGLRLTRVRGVPQCEREEVEALFRLQCEEAAFPEVQDVRGNHAEPPPASPAWEPPTLASDRDAIQDSTSASRHATQPGDIRTGWGNCPRRRSRQIVVGDRPTRATTIGSRSNLDERENSDWDGEVDEGSNMGRPPQKKQVFCEPPRDIAVPPLRGRGRPQLRSDDGCLAPPGSPFMCLPEAPAASSVVA